jgi:hypothetical protein
LVALWVLLNGNSYVCDATHSNAIDAVYGEGKFVISLTEGARYQVLWSSDISRIAKKHRDRLFEPI